MSDSPIGTVAAYLSAIAASVSAVFAFVSAKTAAKKSKAELAHNMEELRQANDRHREALEQSAKLHSTELQQANDRHKQALEVSHRDMMLSLEQSATLHGKEMNLGHYINITQRVFDLGHLFIDHPHLRKYFYDNAVVDSSEDIEKITSFTEYILDFFSSIQEHERLLGDGTPSWKEWNEYISDFFGRSPFLCVYFAERASWYEPGLFEIFRPVGRSQEELIKKQRSALPRKSEHL
ncbi:hypothetical protein OKW30_002483 [Paraburkholderia sp. Clong3]|uniref:hypothetical protein n=1 Tax=unclassified Paraburkholderia TaxID=2615204 RepID=UPI00161F2226|nr:hypothetical protein [Paraburkholderia sp. CI2]MBB5467979.1 hypothetical protein [Paraburkholderia sp. CI2]